MIHVDPRFTRTSAIANIHAPIRAGSDIAFLGGIIRYILANDLWFREFVLAYTNIATIIGDEYRDAEDNDGVFSGFDRDNASYKVTTWQYKDEFMPSPLAEHYVSGEDLQKAQQTREHPPASDPTLQHPNCVYQIMRRHYERYTPEMVERVTGCPQSIFLRICEAVTRNSGRERTGTFCYAVGWTHHSFGVQIIRAAAIIQCLLGNVGRPGGGVLALRGHCSIQGSTDIPTLYNMLPTYLPQPNAFLPHSSLERIPEGRDRADWLVAQPTEIHDLAAEGLVRRACAAEQRVLLRSHSENDWGPIATADDLGDGRRSREGSVRVRTEPGRWRSQFRAGRSGAWRSWNGSSCVILP